MHHKKTFILLLASIIITFFIDSKSFGLEPEKVKDRSTRQEQGILIDLTEQKLFVINTEKNLIVKIYSIASGKENTPSPIGTWVITEKAKWSGGFGTRWLGLNVPWGDYGIHGTNRPHSIGRSLSHGCIRMLNNDVEDLYELVDVGTKVVVYGGPNGPFQKGLRKLKPGDRGGDVYYIQKKLKELNYYSGQLDGVYGETLKKGVIKFRKDKNLEESHFIDKDFYTALGIRYFE